MVQFHSCIPISVGCDTLINHIAFDGCDYICTIRCKCEILRWNPCGALLHRYCTCREYDCICYDAHEHCFWASSRSCCGKLFKLDCSMNEIDYIRICKTEQYGVVTGISYDCCRNTLMVSFPCVVIEIEKDCETTRVFYQTREVCIMGVLCICPCMLLTVYQGHKRSIIVINQWGEKIGCQRIDGLFLPQNLIFNPCTSDCHQSPIWAFVCKKCCYPYLCNTDLSFRDLGFLPCSCNYELCSCDEKPCPGCDPWKDVMESIALMETSLSHILNAEGEKIQKVLAATDDIDKIMCVNREVNQTIVNATHLEHTLYAKLSALCDCGFCDEACGGHGPCRDDEQCGHILGSNA